MIKWEETSYGFRANFGLGWVKLLKPAPISFPSWCLICNDLGIDKTLNSTYELGAKLEVLLTLQAALEHRRTDTTKMLNLVLDEQQAMGNLNA